MLGAEAKILRSGQESFDPDYDLLLVLDIEIVSPNVIVWSLRRFEIVGEHSPCENTDPARLRYVISKKMAAGDEFVIGNQRATRENVEKSRRLPTHV